MRVTFEGYVATDNYVVWLFDSREDRDRFEELQRKDRLLPHEQEEYQELKAKAVSMVDRLDIMIPEWRKRRVRIVVELEG